VTNRGAENNLEPGGGWRRDRVPCGSREVLAGADFGGGVVPFRTAYGAEQYGLGASAGGEGGFGKGRARLVDGDAANKLVIEMKGVTELLGDSVEHTRGYARDFRSNAVSAENYNLCFHVRLLTPLTAWDPKRDGGDTPVWLENPCGKRGLSVSVPLENDAKGAYGPREALGYRYA
jgi:hypothetical protein